MLTFTKRSLIVSIIYSWGFRITNLFVVTYFRWERKRRGRGYQCCEKLFGNKTNFFPLFQGTHTFNMKKKNNLFTIIFSIKLSFFISGESGRRVRSGPQGRLLAHRPTGGGSTTCCKSTHPSDTTFAPVDLLKRNQSCDIISFLSSVLVQKPLTTSMIKKADHHKKKRIWSFLLSVIHNHSQRLSKTKNFSELGCFMLNWIPEKMRTRRMWSVSPSKRFTGL